ncbi:uncharacterized protein LOC125518274 [Triticum urartu]|uniref:Uncharacterized protein n=1 Tax=Triticum turgidum subsp. durum TaxID=4567 RepID=A0A9R0Q533_TRITD|nr:uncharacterized protein LOC119365942 [Triticum dicoccoides]XP_048539128.1 uncharacterized protein LOC125518274 [Triticum urartu]VAH02898.1 unnamed protein product [Triticum turgidum subsp. durum]
MATRRSPATTHHRLLLLLLPLLLIGSFLLPLSSAYRPGDIIPMLRSGQYHGSRSVWFDVIGRHCPVFAVNREVLMPIPKPTGFTGADPYKITFQIGHEKFHVPWLYVINRKSSEVPLIDFHLKYTGNDLLGVTAKVVDMPHHFVELHPDIKKDFWDQQNWPKYVLVSYTWEEQSEIDVTAGFYVLFGSGLVLSFILAIYVLQSSQDKLTRFVREAVSDSSLPEGGVAKVE